jgi:hypothetical protein
VLDKESVVKFVKTPENIARVQTALTRSSGKSVKRLSQERGLKQSSTLTIIRKYLKMFPYKIQMQQALADVDKDRRVVFCDSLRQYLEDNSTVIHHIRFSDEAQFHLNGYVNKQNMCVWSTENPHAVMETPLQPEKCMVLCAISLAGVVGPIFLDDTINAESCLQFL